MTRLFRALRFAALGTLAAAVGFGLPRGGAAGTTGATAWLTGRAMDERLATPVGVAWVDTPLRAALASLAGSQRVAVWLDRRVDPGAPVNLTADGAPLKDILGDVARRGGLGIGRFDAAIVYLGPPGAITRLKTVAAMRREEAKRLPAAAARTFTQVKPMRWNDFATPRDVLAELASSGGIQLTDEDRVPHDLLAAADLPAMSLVDRLTLILGQFDLTFEFHADGRAVRIVPMPAIEEQPLPETWHETAPATKKNGRNDRGAAAAETRIERFRVENQPLGGVLRQVAARLKLELRIDEDLLRRSGKSLEHRVSFHVENVTVDQLFDAILRPEGLTFRRHGSTLEIRAAE